MISAEEMKFRPDLGDVRRQQTLGEYRVGVSFNPSSNPDVDEIKKMAAALIDRIDALRVFTTDAGLNVEKGWQIDEAMRLVETAAMHAVKAATKGPRDA